MTTTGIGAGNVTFLAKGLGFVFWGSGRRKVKGEINTLNVMEAYYINFVPYYGQNGQRTLLLKNYGCITEIGQYNLGAKKVELRAICHLSAMGNLPVIFTIYLQFDWFREQLNKSPVLNLQGIIGTSFIWKKKYSESAAHCLMQRIFNQ